MPGFYLAVSDGTSKHNAHFDEMEFVMKTVANHFFCNMGVVVLLVIKVSDPDGFPQKIDHNQ